jgi:uncharacterized protein YdhG (YjbR/CyaY superfamily)
MGADFKSVDEYLASQPETAWTILADLRATIRGAIPQAEETISYRIPTYKLQGRAVLYFAGWKRHYSLYPASARLVAAFSSELAPYQISKGTIRFPYTQPASAQLIAAIAKFRAEEVARRP